MSQTQTRVNYAGAYFSTTGRLALEAWGLTLRVLVAGSANTVEAFLNGVRIYHTAAASLGAAPVASVQIGNNTSSQPFDLVVDEVTADSPPV